MDLPDTATILLLDLPSGALCGMDLLSFTTSPRFHGIKTIPKGFHFIYTSATTSLSVRHGLWINPDTSSTGPGETLIKKWDVNREELLDEKDESEQLRWKANIGGLWHECLTPYRQFVDGDGAGVMTPAEEASKLWAPLVDCITPSLLGRITGGSWNDWTLSTSSAMKQDMEEIPGLTYGGAIRREKELGFLPINLKQTWREGAIGRERTEAAKDRSWALGDIVANYCSWGEEKEIVGEMQFSFLMVVTLGNFSCLEQWKRVLNLVFTCQTAVKNREDLYVRILRVLRLQLQRCNDVEGGMFELSDEGGVMLVQLLKGFRRGLEDSYGQERSEVRDEYDLLEAYVKREFGWELNDSFVRRGVLELEDGEQVEMELNELEGEDERGEYAPLVVDLGDAAAPFPGF
ncbi:MAG: hypothetical protein M1839_007566 [Geoglossum umbratile]|nr:MAG: hypothetical protein M1839_007566 [Geoglossum umbratile]